MDEEKGFTLSEDKYNIEKRLHFITEDTEGEIDYGEGRGVYIAGLPYSAQNTRLLLRALFWSANREGDMKKAYSTNINVDCSYYPEQGKYALVNNTAEPQETVFYDIDGKEKEVVLQKGDIV